MTILEAIIPIAYRILNSAVEEVSFSDLMQVMSTLADAGSDKGHVLLFQAATEWIELWYATAFLSI